jgi:nitroimidazol reductase NimA-like FMN-containing flavoprotein (pyridoxamine 5'-phosphate oxidase superfamily)
MATADEVYRDHPTRAEIDEVLSQRLSATLGTLNDDGSIHLTQLIFLFEEGRFRLETATTTRKARNIAARSTASLLVHGTASTGRNLMVEAEGSARLINHRLRAKYIVDEAIDAVDLAWGRFDDVAIELVPARWRSWTGTALAERTAADVGRAYEDLWRE